MIAGKIKFAMRYMYERLAVIKRKIFTKGYTQLIREWGKAGKPIPMPEQLKRFVMRIYAKKFSLRTFIETGTLSGGTVDAVKDIFRKIFSIELSENFFLAAKHKFLNCKHITILHGDSAEVLPALLSTISQPCLFYLDGHYSGEPTTKGKKETPILQELQHILNHPTEDHVILIDDARLFTGHGDWPTIEELRTLIFNKHPDWVFEVKNDIIRIHKNKSKIRKWLKSNI